MQTGREEPGPSTLIFSSDLFDQHDIIGNSGLVVEGPDWTVVARRHRRHSTFLIGVIGKVWSKYSCSGP